MKNRDESIRHVSMTHLDRFAAWASRKPAIAIMGEFSSGKSTLLNLLLGKSILPTQVTATQLPPVWLRYGTDAPFRLDTDGVRHDIDLSDLKNIPLKKTRFIRIYTQAPILEKCDLLDTPGISDPKIPTDSWIRTIGYANAVLWCTQAGQAWRESERSAWEVLPERLREHSLLMVTRADKIVSERDFKKIDRRLERETGDLFNNRHFVSLTRAVAYRQNAGDPQLWIDTGAEAVMAGIDNIINAVNLHREQLLSRYQLDKNAPVEPVKAAQIIKKAAQIPEQQPVVPVAEAQTSLSLQQLFDEESEYAAQEETQLAALRDNRTEDQNDTFFAEFNFDEDEMQPKIEPVIPPSIQPIARPVPSILETAEIGPLSEEAADNDAFAQDWSEGKLAPLVLENPMFEVDLEDSVEPVPLTENASSSERFFSHLASLGQHTLDNFEDDPAPYSASNVIHPFAKGRPFGTDISTTNNIDEIPGTKTQETQTARVIWLDIQSKYDVESLPQLKTAFSRLIA